MAEEDISQLLSEQHEEIDAVATFKTIVRTALKGTPDIQALVREWPTLLSAEMQFRDLPRGRLGTPKSIERFQWLRFFRRGAFSLPQNGKNGRNCSQRTFDARDLRR